MPLIETCPALPLDGNDGALLGVGATPGAKIAALNKSWFKGQFRLAVRAFPPFDLGRRRLQV